MEILSSQLLIILFEQHEVLFLYMRIHERDHDTIVACCDEGLLDTEIKEDKICLSVKESFYGKESCKKEELVNAMKQASIINLIGEKCVNIGIDEGFIDEDNVLVISEVPHAQMISYSGPE